MAKYLIKTSSDKFFCFDREQLIKTSLIGGLFGVLTIVLTGWLSFGELIVNFRVGLLVMAVVVLMLLLKNQIEAALMIVSLTMIVLWNQWLQLEQFWQAVLFYGLLSSAVMTLFGWVSQLKNWQLRLGVGMIVMLLLSVI